MKGKYFEVESKGKFTLLLFQPAYRELTCSKNAYIRDNKTGRNCGTTVTLCRFVNNVDGTTNEKPTLEPEGDYEVVQL